MQTPTEGIDKLYEKLEQKRKQYQQVKSSSSLETSMHVLAVTILHGTHILASLDRQDKQQWTQAFRALYRQAKAKEDPSCQAKSNTEDQHHQHKKPRKERQLSVRVSEETATTIKCRQRRREMNGITSKQPFNVQLLQHLEKQRPKTKESAKDLNPIREKKRKALLQYKETQTKRNLGKLRKQETTFKRKQNRL
ncbi:hypothetical protein OS493_000855 [Desmophyllum pertusum]|uniref:Uncharacterized protein n=1 Tax=Desmophyllum pertusum TaxID=174260 RepID=A0A9X0D799_9CNID|nr:hypothetical protein OS493_000855 [Desmophyllum pertusum]